MANKIRLRCFFTPFILWLQTESAIPRIISHSAPALKSSSDPNKTYQRPGWPLCWLAGKSCDWWSPLGSSLRTRARCSSNHDPARYVRTRETETYGGISDSAITFGIQNRLSPRALAQTPDPGPINSQGFPKIFTSLTKRFGKIVNEDQDYLWPGWGGGWVRNVTGHT